MGAAHEASPLAARADRPRASTPSAADNLAPVLQRPTPQEFHAHVQKVKEASPGIAPEDAVAKARSEVGPPKLTSQQIEQKKREIMASGAAQRHVIYSRQGPAAEAMAGNKLNPIGMHVSRLNEKPPTLTHEPNAGYLPSNPSPSAHPTDLMNDAFEKAFEDRPVATSGMGKAAEMTVPAPSRTPWNQTQDEYLKDWKNGVLDEVGRAGKFNKNGGKEVTYYVPANIQQHLKETEQTPEQYADKYIADHRDEILEGHKNEVERAAKRGQVGKGAAHYQSVEDPGARILNAEADQHVSVANQRAKLADVAKRIGNHKQAETHVAAMREHYAKAAELRQQAGGAKPGGKIHYDPGTHEMPMLLSRVAMKMNRPSPISRMAGMIPMAMNMSAGDLTGGHWVTIDHQAVYLKGDTIASGHLAGKSVHEAHESIAKGRDREAKNSRNEAKVQAKQRNHAEAEKHEAIAKFHEGKAAELRTERAKQATRDQAKKAGAAHAAKEATPGGKKTANESPQPVTAYHVGPQKIDKFRTDIPTDSAWGPGAYFAPSAEEANNFQQGRPGFIHTATISAKKTLDASAGKSFTPEQFQGINKAAAEDGLKPIPTGFKNSPIATAYGAWYRQNGHSKEAVNGVLRKAGFDAIKDEMQLVSLDPANIKINSVDPINQGKAAKSKLRDTGAGLTGFAEPSTAANPNAVKESDIHSAIAYVAAKHADTGMAPIHEVREHIRKKFGDHAAAHENFDPAVMRMRYADKVRAVPISDASRLGADRDKFVRGGIPGQGETFGYLSKPNS